MQYQFQFGLVFARLDYLLDGMWTTIWISAVSIVIGFLIGLFAAIASQYGSVILRLLVRGYVEVFRNTPFLVQVFIIYLALPGIGIRLSPIVAGIIALSINFGAYVTEIIRAGIESVHRSQIEAGESLGMTKWQIVRDIVLTPALSNVYPSLSTQITLLLLGSSIVSTISVAELTGNGGVLRTETARPFEVFILIGGIYFVLAVVLKAIVDLIVLKVLRWRVPG